MMSVSFVGRGDVVMEPERVRNHNSDSGALHFELVCDKKDVYDNLIALRQQVQDRATRVSPIHRLYDTECLVEGPEDSLLDAKLLSQGIMLHDGKIVVINPQSIAVFVVELSNKAFVHFGFVTYPSSIVIDGKNVKVPHSDKAVWSGVLFMNESFGHESYKELYQFVRFLKNRGVQVNMNDNLSSLQYS
jgi:hypothetical protein